jgi:hypothetical protein
MKRNRSILSILAGAISGYSFLGLVALTGHNTNAHTYANSNSNAYADP